VQAEQLRSVEAVRLGGDEMNLVEYPFAALWSRQHAGTKIEHEWETRHPVTGRSVKAVWRVEGSPELGLPGPSDERLYLALMELSREQGLARQIVTFTRHDLVKRLGWPHNQHSYRMVLAGFRRLKTVAITSENAFWDASIQSFRNVGFGIIDNYDIVAERTGRKRNDHAAPRELPLSSFRWNDVLFGSVQAGYIRVLDVGFALSLSGDTTLRLFRYLDKKAYDGRKSFEIELAVLCDRHLGMKPTPYDSVRRARLKAAHDELIEQGFLEKVSFEPMKTRRAQKACYTFGARRGAGLVEKNLVPEACAPHFQGPPPAGTQLSFPAVPPELPQPPCAGSAQEPGCAGTPQGESEEPCLVARMTAIGVSPEVARDFTATVPSEELLLQLECLGDRNPKDGAAVFVKAVREKWGIPQAHLDRLQARLQAHKAQEVQKAQQQQQAARKAAKGQEAALHELEAAQLDALWEQLDAPTRAQLEAQARVRLGVLGQIGRAPSALVAMRRALLRELRASLG
jgi:hypothetical protein